MYKASHLAISAIAGLIVFMATVSISHPAWAGTPVTKPTIVPAQNPARLPSYIAWTAEPWTGNDRPYSLARAQIDQAVAQGQNPLSLLEQEKIRAGLFPSDPLFRFRWGYAAYKATFTVATQRAGMDLLEGVEPALRSAPSPHTYNYSRLLFLVIDYMSPEYAAKPLAGRLLRMNPNDDDVKFFLIDALLDYPARSKADEAEAVALGQSLLKSHPQSLGVHAKIVTIYTAIWSSSYRQADANRAIAECQRYADLLPLADPNRRYVSALIQHIQKMQKLGKVTPPVVR